MRFLTALLASCLPEVLCQAAAITFGEQDIQSPQHVMSDDAAPALSRRPSLFDKHGGRKLTGFIAIGDSYSAGIGTGVQGKEEDCRRGLHAYPSLIHADLSSAQGPNTTSFQWLSCTGATTDDLLSRGGGSSSSSSSSSSNGSSQLDRLNTTAPADFAVLSIGGNDLGFFDVINACIFRFYSFYSGTCQAALQRSDQLLASPDFELRLDLVLTQLLERVHWDRRPWFVVTVTGYARFFNADTAPCDDASLGVWWGGPKLGRDVRRGMNALVDRVNAKLQRAIARANRRFATPKVFFVDYDAEFEGHRFCEPGVAEPDYNRTDTWFFLVGGPDNNAPFDNATAAAAAEHEQLYRAESLPPGSELADPEVCLGPAQRSGDWGELAICYMAMARQRDPTLRLADEQFRAANSMWYVPTYYGKVFHPRSLGHEVIRDKVYEIWEKQDL